MVERLVKETKTNQNGYQYQPRICLIKSSEFFAWNTLPLRISSKPFSIPVLRCRLIVHPIFFDNVRRKLRSVFGKDSVTSSDTATVAIIFNLYRFTAAKLRYYFEFCKHLSKKLSPRQPIRNSNRFFDVFTQPQVPHPSHAKHA